MLATLAGCPACETIYRDRDGILVASDVPYLADGATDPFHRLDIYYPDGVTPGVNDGDVDAPVLLFFHGGYWVAQDKQYYEFASGLYGNVGVAMAREGFVVVNSNYRLFPDGSIEDMLADVDAAATYTRERFPRAPLVISGHSAGAHLAAAAALLPDGPRTEVDGLALLSGIYEIESGVDNDSEENIRDVFIPIFGDTPEARAAWSVRDALRRSSIPTLLLTGSKDLPGILVDDAVLEDALDGSATTTFVEVEGSDHADIVLQIASERDAVSPAVVELLRTVER